MHGVGGLRRRVRRALAAGFDLRQAGAVEDIGIALAAPFIVATEQAAAARNDSGIARTEQGRALVVRRQTREFGDDPAPAL